MAKALFELRSYARCIATIDRALASDVVPLTGSLRADVDELRARAIRFVGRATIATDPPNATATLDGRPLEAPLSRERVIDVGSHTLEVSVDAYHPARRTFEVRGGESVTVSVKLQPVRVTVATTPGDARRTGLVLTVGATALAAAGVIASSIWFVDRDAVVDECNTAARTGARCANADSVAFQRDAALWTAGISAAAAVVSVVALVTVVRSSSSSSSARIGCGPSSGGVACGFARSW